MTCHRIVMQDAWRRSVFILPRYHGEIKMKQSTLFTALNSLVITSSVPVKPVNNNRAATGLK